jgi:hypothetical protein
MSGCAGEEMETAIAFAAGMLLTLIALALEDWTRLSKRRNATHEEEFGAAKEFSGANRAVHPPQPSLHKGDNDNPDCRAYHVESEVL